MGEGEVSDVIVSMKLTQKQAGKPYMKSMRQREKIEHLESKLKETSEFIQKLGPTIDYDIVAEIEEMLR